jgi:small subunit ribosomal protein S18
MELLNRKRTLGIKRLRLKTKKHSARYVMPKNTKIDYKEISLLQKYLSDRGKILSRRISGVTSKDQRAMTLAIKRARYLGLLPVGGSKRR